MNDTISPVKSKKMSLSTKAAWAFVGLLFYMIVAPDFQDPPTPEEIAQKKEAEARRDKETTMKSIISSCYNGVRSSLKDPYSMKTNLILASENPEITCISYHAKNSFGAYMPDVAVCLNNEWYNSDKMISKHCSNKKLGDYTYLIRSIERRYSLRYE